MVETTLNLVKRNRLEFIIILGLIILAAFLRLYKIDEYMTFLGDEGRDALMIKRILVDHDIPLLGPPTSIGNIYLGPLYYYMMAVPMAIFWLNPVAAAVQVAIIGILTICLIYYLAREWFGVWPATISALLYATSPVNIIYSRSSWNPNPAPFFALLVVLGLYKVQKTGNFLWVFLTGVSLAFAVQMHYLALILIPMVLVMWCHEIFYGGSLRRKMVNKFKGTLMGIVAFLVLMSPLVIFDLKYNFLNYKAITAFFSNRETTVNLNPFNTIERIVPIYKDDLIGQFLSVGNQTFAIILSILILVPMVFALIERIKKGKIIWAYLMLGTWLLIGIFGLSLYKQTIYDHYLGFLNPVPFLLLGSLIYLLVTSNLGSLVKKVGYGLLIILVVTLSYINLQNSPLKVSPNNQLVRTQQIAKYVISEAGGKPFNFALLAKNNYDSAYQFYLEIYGFKPMKVPFDITDQLFVVCEDLVCDPVVSPKQEIAHFGMTKIDKESNFLGVKIYKLRHNPSGKK